MHCFVQIFCKQVIESNQKTLKKKVKHVIKSNSFIISAIIEANETKKLFVMATLDVSEMKDLSITWTCCLHHQRKSIRNCFCIPGIKIDSKFQYKYLYESITRDYLMFFDYLICTFYAMVIILFQGKS